MADKPGYGRRKMGTGLKLPPFSWLYNYGGSWRMMPEGHPDKCSWCLTPFTVIDRYWRLCPKCDRRPEAIAV